MYQPENNDIEITIDPITGAPFINIKGDTALQVAKEIGEDRGKEKASQIAGIIEKEKRTEEKLPLPEVALFDPDFLRNDFPFIFGRKLTKNDKTEIEIVNKGKTFSVYKTTIGDFETKYTMPTESGTPVLYQKGKDILIALASFALQQNSLKIKITKREILDYLDITDDGGKSYEDLDTTLHSLWEAGIEITNLKTKKITGGFRLLNSFKIEGEGKGQSLSIGISDISVKSALPYILNLEDKKGSKYISYTRKLLLENYSSPYIRNGIEYLRNLRGLKMKLYPIKVSTLLKEKMQITDDIYKRKGECLKLVNELIQKGKELNLIESYEPVYNGHADDIRYWKITFRISGGGGKGRTEYSADIREGIEPEIAEMADWLSSDKSLRKPPQEVKAQLENCIRTYGLARVQYIYLQEKGSVRGHPANFWRGIAELKKTRLGGV